jgi:hypothetical protein
MRLLKHWEEQVYTSAGRWRGVVGGGRLVVGGSPCPHPFTDNDCMGEEKEEKTGEVSFDLFLVLAFTTDGQAQWAQSRLPASAQDMPMNSKLQGAQGQAKEQPDSYLPHAQTCFFSLSLPAYSTK